MSLSESLQDAFPEYNNAPSGDIDTNFRNSDSAGLINITGGTCYSKVVTNNDVLHLDALDSGFYIIHVTDSFKNIVYKAKLNKE